MITINEPILLRVSFPNCLSEGKDIYYTIYNADGNIYLSRRNTGVVSFSNGVYGVEHTFITSGGYVIKWDIDGTPYTAEEELNIYDYASNPVFQDIQEKVQAIYDMEYGKWEILPGTSEMVFYRGNLDEIARFDLKDIVGNPSYINVFSRIRKGI